MPAPNNYFVPQPQVSDYFNAVRQGTQDRQAQEADVRKTALAKYLPAALTGNDPNARQQALAQADPNEQIQLANHFSQMDAQTLARTKEQQSQLASMAVAATTPQAWAAVNAQAKQFNPSAPDIPFEARDQVIAKAQTVAEQLDQALKQKSFALDQSRTQAQNAASYASAAASRASAAGGGEASLPPQTLSFMADQYLAGDRSVLTNLGRGAQGAKNIIALRTAIAQKAEAAGLSPNQVASIIGEFEGYKAGQRVLGGRVATLGMAVNEANSMADLVTQASEAVPRSQFIPVNTALNAWQTNTGSTEQVRFGAAVNSFINAYARAINPTGQPTINDKEHAREMLAKAQSNEQVGAVIDQLKKEMAAAQKAPGQTREEMRTTFRGEGGAPPAASGVIRYDSSGKRIP